MPKKGQLKAAPLGLTPARRAKALEYYAASGLYARVYESLGVHQSTFERWRKQHPDFQAELDAVGAAVDRRIGELARSVLEQRLIEMRDRVRPRQQGIVQKTGQVVELEQPHHYDIATIRTGLTKLDPLWTHPPKENLAKVEETLEELLKRTDTEDAKQRGSD